MYSSLSQSFFRLLRTYLFSLGKEGRKEQFASQLFFYLGSDLLLFGVHAYLGESELDGQPRVVVWTASQIR